MNAQGEAPVYYRYTTEGKRNERSTGIFCTPEHWENHDGDGLSDALTKMSDECWFNLHCRYAPAHT